MRAGKIIEKGLDVCPRCGQFQLEIYKILHMKIITYKCKHCETEFEAIEGDDKQEVAFYNNARIMIGSIGHKYDGILLSYSELDKGDKKVIRHYLNKVLEK